MVQTLPSGETAARMFERDQRNKEEKGWEVEEKRRYLEKQSFVVGAEKRELKERMRGIEERAQRAMETARARKGELEEASVALSQLALDRR